MKQISNPNFLAYKNIMMKGESLEDSPFVGFNIELLVTILTFRFQATAEDHKKEYVIK